jgi:stage V sporulation protein AB
MTAKAVGYDILFAVFGLSGGLIAGSAFVALLTALEVPARLIALSYTRRHTRTYEFALAAGAWVAAFWLPFPYTLGTSPWVLVIPGLLMGSFVGTLASALAETIGVIPVTARRTGVGSPIFKLIWFAVAGKILGSLVFWMFPPLTQ